MNPSPEQGQETPSSVPEERIRELVRRLAEVEERLTSQTAERKQAERRLAAEHAVSQILALSSTLNDAAPAILQALCEKLDWDGGTLWVVDRNANVLRCAEVWQAPKVEAPAFVQDTRHRTFAPGIGLPGRVWASQSLAWIPDMTTEEFIRAALAAKEGLHGAVGFPLRSGTEFLGVMEFLSREIRQPDAEIIQMMTSIGSHISQFIERREAERDLRRQEYDHRIAREIQQGLLPKAIPTLAGFQIGGWSATATEVGGDCFDFIPMLVGGQECLGILIGDASGHGIGAALLMGETRAYLRALALTCTDVGTLLTLSNHRLVSDLATDHFVTLLLLLLDPRTRSLHYASAGHCPGYVLDHRGEIKAVLSSTGMPLGIDLASDFPVSPAITLEQGDLIFLFTDGIPEARSSDRKCFGEKRTLSIVKAHQHEKPEEIFEALHHAVSGFTEHHVQVDDMTAVIIKVENLAQTDPSERRLSGRC